jgi:YidC/Oxa1 family membrane protein insertase
LEQQDLNKRLLLALALSFLVFIGYSYLFPSAQPPVEKSNPQTHTQSATDTPTVHQDAKSAPTVKSEDQPAPVQTKINALATIKSKRYIITVDDLGRIARMELLEKKYKDEDGNNLQIIDPTKVKPLEIRFADPRLNEEAFKTPYVNQGASDVEVSNRSHTLTLTQNLSGLTVTKKITFEPNGAYSVDIQTSKPVDYFITPGYRPVADHARYLLVRGALVKTADGVITTIEDGEAKGDETFKNATIASAFDRYQASLFYDFDKGMDVSIVKVGEGDPLIFVAKQGNAHINAYIGPKEYKVLTSLHPELEDAIEFGWFTFLAKPFFKILIWIEDHVGNWGWAIIIFTFLVKLVLFPLSYKGMMSMQKLKDLAPKMKELREKYKGDPAKLNMKMMEMYKKHGANPMGGCLPLILQIPVFFALYRVLLNAVELQGAPWILWIQDLSKMDPYYVLPVLMGVSMWFQQKITPSNFTDPMQEKIFKWFPVIMTVFFVTFPAGLVLYWLTNNILTIAQQYYINRMYEKYKQQKAAVANKKD